MDKRIRCMLLALPVSLVALAEGPNYALPSSAKDVETVINAAPGAQTWLTQGGTVPSESRSTCDDKPDGSSKSTVGFSAEHYFPPNGKDTIKQKLDMFQMIGGYAGAQRSEYDTVGAPGSTARPFLRKGAFTAETIAGAEAVYYSVTLACVQEKNKESTHWVYRARWHDEDTLVDIDNSIYAGSAELARKYAAEMISKARNVDFGALR